MNPDDLLLISEALERGDLRGWETTDVDSRRRAVAGDILCERVGLWHSRHLLLESMGPVWVK